MEPQFLPARCHLFGPCARSLVDGADDLWL